MPTESPQKQSPPSDALSELKKIRRLLSKIDTWIVTLGTIYILNMIVRMLFAFREISHP